MTTNPVQPLIALLRPQAPDNYSRDMIYDPTWSDPSYNAYQGKRIVPALNSLVVDTDGTLLRVTAIDPVTDVPSYEGVALGQDTTHTASSLNFGASVLRLFTDNRSLPYTLTPDSKCVILGKSPRFYTLTRYPNTPQATIISQNFDATGKLTGVQIPMLPTDNTQTSWYLPTCRTTVALDLNEEILVQVYSETGTEVYSSTLFAKPSAVINESSNYTPTIVGLTVSGTQRLTSGVFFLYEKQDFTSLGLTVTLVYDTGQTETIPVDGVKCFLYGDTDFITSFAGLKQQVTVKYFRSSNEAIAPGLGDQVGEMISVDVDVMVIPNTLGVTAKILAIPFYASATARYVVKYWMYFADGRGFINITDYVTFPEGLLVTDASSFGLSQAITLSVDMSKVDPAHYPTQTTYQQRILVQFNAPNTLVKWTIKDSPTSPYILGQDSAAARRPILSYDQTRKQYFVPTSVFGNVQAFVNSFYTQTNPPYDATVSPIPQQPTHFVIRDMSTGIQLVTAPISLSSYAVPFNILRDTNGAYANATVVVEFLSILSSSSTNVLFGCPVNVSPGTYLG